MRAEVMSLESYKDVLRNFIVANRHVRAYRTQLAKAARCQISFLSHVLNSHAHLNQDHAFRIADFLKMDRQETEYFMTLLSLERSDEPRLREYWKTKLHDLANQNLASRGNVTIQDKDLRSALYHSDWKHALVHAATGIFGIVTADRIARRLNLGEKEVARSLELLSQIGILKPAKSRTGQISWQATEESVHLQKHSPFEKNFHASWRLRAVQSLDKQTPGDVHYASAFSLTEKQFKHLQKLLVDFMKETDAVMSEGKPTTLACLCLDLFQQ